MIYNLNIQESYLVFKTLKYIFSCDMNNETIFTTPIRIKNEFNITKKELKDIYDRELILSNDLKIKWIESIEFDKSFIIVLLNKNIFNHFNNDFIEFVKSITFDYRHIATLKFSEMFFNKSKLFLSLNDFKLLDNNTILYLYNVEKEIKKLKEDELIIQDIKKLKYIKTQLKTLNTMFNVLSETKDFNFYLQYLNIIKNDFKSLYNRELVFKLKTKLINGNVEYGFIVKELFNKSNIPNENSNLNKYISSINNIFIDDKNSIFNYRA